MNVFTFLWHRAVLTPVREALDGHVGGRGQKHPDHRGLCPTLILPFLLSSCQGQAIALGSGLLCCDKTWSASSLNILEYVQEYKKGVLESSGDSGSKTGFQGILSLFDIESR